jgi:HSP20 family protein
MAEHHRSCLHSLFLPAARSIHEGPWQPPADVYRSASGWLIKFDLAGIRPDEVVVRVSGRCLTVSGCRRDWVTEEGHSHYRMEIAYSHFERVIELPIDLEPARMATDYRDGMLLVRVQTENEP